MRDCVLILDDLIPQNEQEVHRHENYQDVSPFPAILIDIALAALA